MYYFQNVNGDLFPKYITFSTQGTIQLSFFKSHRSLELHRGSSCVMDLHITGPRFKTRLVQYFLLSF